MEDVRIAGRQDPTEKESAAYNDDTLEEDNTGYNKNTSNEDTAPYKEITSALKELVEDQEMPETEYQTNEETSKDDINKQVTCIFCEFESTDMAIMKNHVNDHPNEDIFNCKVCDKPLKKTSFREHIQSIHSGLRVDCPECDYQTNTRSSLNSHRFKEHNIGSKPFQCPKCRYKAKFRNFFKRHMKEKHDINMPREDNENCDQCVYSTKSASSLKMHKIRRHKVNFTEH